MCLKPIRVGRDSYPCGKCYECIRQKQMDYAQLMMFQAIKKHSCHFVTFTYSDETRPIRCLDRTSGDLFWLEKGASLRDSYFSFINEMQLRCNSPWKKYSHCELGLMRPGSLLCMCASLRRRDFRLWLKNARVQYERKYKVKLPDFTYFAVGEYGEKTFAPHYHAMFFGLEKRHLDFMLELWKKSFGFTLCKELPIVSSQDVAKCCMYVAKYMNKGSYDCPELEKKDSLMEKPRIMCSSGMSVRDGLRSLFTLDGKLSIYAGSYQISDLQQVLGRMEFQFGGNSYKIGKHFYRYALQVPNETFQKPSRSKDSEVESYQITYNAVKCKDKIEIYKSYHEPSLSKFKASPLQAALSYMLQDLARARDSEKKRKNFELFEASHELREVFGSFENFFFTVLSSEQSFADSKRQKDVRKSVF